MNGIERIAHTYSSVFVTLLRWAEDYVGRQAALPMVCSVLAQWFRLACNAYQTNQGPYGEIADMLLAQIMRNGMIDPLKSSAWPLTTLGIPTEGDLCEIARLHALVYHASVSCHWSIAEREEIYLWLRTTVPPVVGTADGTIIAIEYDHAPLPLRRAVELLQIETCGDQLICAVTQQIWEDEERTGLSWQRAVMR